MDRDSFQRILIAALVALSVFSAPARAENNGGGQTPPAASAPYSSRTAPRDPRGWTFVMPTRFHHADQERYDAQDLEDRIPDGADFERALEARLRGLAPLMAQLKPGENYIVRLKQPNDVTAEEQAATEATIRRVFARALPQYANRLTVESHRMDLLPRYYMYPRNDPHRPSAQELANQPPPPERTEEEKRKEPAEMRRMKNEIAIKQSAILGAIQAFGATNPHLDNGAFAWDGFGGILARQWLSIGANVASEYLYKRYQTEVSDYMERKGLEILFNVGGMGLGRPTLGEAFGAPIIGSTLGLKYFAMLVGGAALITPNFLMGLRATDRLRQMGYINQAERQRILLDAAYYSMASLGAMSSGFPVTRLGLFFSVPKELSYYWKAQYQSQTRDPLQNVLVLAHPSLYRNRVDLDAQEATEATRPIEGRSNEEVLADFRDGNWREIVPKGAPPNRALWFAREMGYAATRTAVGAAHIVASTPRTVGHAARYTGRQIAECAYGVLGKHGS